MSTQGIFTQAARNYRDFPVLDTHMGKENMVVVKRLFCLVLSQERLQETITEHKRDYGFEDEGGYVKCMMGRLKAVEDQLRKAEEKHGIKLTEFDYWTK